MAQFEVRVKATRYRGLQSLKQFTLSQGRLVRIRYITYIKLIDSLQSRITPVMSLRTALSHLEARDLQFLAEKEPGITNEPLTLIYMVLIQATQRFDTLFNVSEFERQSRKADILAQHQQIARSSVHLTLSLPALT